MLNKSTFDSLEWDKDSEVFMKEIEDAKKKKREKSRPEWHRDYSLSHTS